ncbi:hypothetical protein K504DRAFT_539601 [Pleomassaria siparia CBS 279.74]|uniref:Uncharacterized protein n=1 Tax=Pleomassaria siparia CBS 279.74 TaxID=1314801 RepID=A0A6G1JQ85_9PLEO|nr:hypothetical protein K504DRAFT_539601 [Pleomassaria siparia CBS 279.74]
MAAKKLATKDRRQQGKHHALEAQREIRLRLPFPVPAEPRLYLAKSAFSPKLAPRLGKADRAKVEGRTITTIANNGSITHAGVPNPNYVAGADIPQYAALRFSRCISPDIARQLLKHVKVLQEARMPFQTTASHGNTFKQAWIGLWRQSSATPFVSAGRRQKKPVLDQGIKNVMQMLDQSLGRAASYLRKVDEPTYTRIRQSHRDITKAVLSSLCGHAGAEGH